MRKSIFTIPLLVLTFALTGPAFGHSGHEHEASSQQSNETTKKERKSPGLGLDPHSPASAYKPGDVLGWKLHVHEDLLADEAIYQQVYDELHHQLFRITKLLPAEKVALLKQVPIWLELRNPYSGNCQYHPSKKWLEGNGFLPEKAKAVELSSAKGFLRSSLHGQPYVMLHELAHAYHDQHLSFDHKAIIDSFKKAETAGNYDKVMHINGRTKRAYAMTDHKEYFAEATEAYFGTNDHFPFVRPELKAHDPQIYAIVREVWGVK